MAWQKVDRANQRARDRLGSAGVWLSRCSAQCRSTCPISSRAAAFSAALEEIGQLDRHWGEHLESHTPAEPKRSRARWLALSTFCHAMLNSAEFIFY